MKKMNEAISNSKEDNSDKIINFDVLPNLVGYHLRRAQQVVFNDFVRSLGCYEITPGQFGVALLIYANPGLTQSALARAVGIERSTMVAVIDALEARELVERRRSLVDRRSYALVLSPRGQDWIKKIKPIVENHDDGIAKNLSFNERVKLISLLSKIARN